MDFQSTFKLLLVIGAIWAGIVIYKDHGLSWTTAAAPLIIWALAFLILWVGNMWAMDPIEAQADGLASHGTSMLNAAVPAMAPEARAAENSAGSNESFGGDSTGNGSQSFGGDGGGGNTTAAPTEPPAAPNAGDVRWTGKLNPPYGDPFILIQVQCFGGRATLIDMAMQNSLPSGVRMSIVPIKTAMQAPDNEEWEITVTAPHAQQQPAKWTSDGVIARAMKKALGGETTTGSSSWPLVQQSWNGTGWGTVDPLTCNFQ